MTRDFDGATEYLEINNAIATVAPFTVVAWVNLDDIIDAHTIFSLSDKDVSNHYMSLSGRGGIAGDPIEALARAAANIKQARTTTGYSQDTWHHAVARFSSSSARQALIDGGSKGTEAVLVVPLGLDRTSIGRLGDSTPNGELLGEIAHVAVWNIGLSDAEVRSLADGLSPMRMRPDNLINYWPINGQSPEPDLIRDFHLTVTGTPTITDEPPGQHQAMVAPA